MNKRERILSVLLYSVFICYILLLIKVLFFSRISLSELFEDQRTISRSINLVPFHSIWEFIAGSSENAKRFSFGNVVGNIVLFIPLGTFLPVFKTDKRVRTNLLRIFIVSLLVEIMQGILGIGVADIDDIILNCLGGLIGILVYKLFLLFLRDEYKTRTVLTILSALIGLPAMFYLLFMIKMRF